MRTEQAQQHGGWRAVAKELTSQMGKKESPSWDGRDPGKTLRTWLKAQLLWQLRTPTPPELWGVALLEALPTDTLNRALADTVPDTELMSVDGHVKIMERFWLLTRHIWKQNWRKQR